MGLELFTGWQMLLAVAMGYTGGLLVGLGWRRGVAPPLPRYLCARLRAIEREARRTNAADGRGDASAGGFTTPGEGPRVR